MLNGLFAGLGFDERDQDKAGKMVHKMMNRTNNHCQKREFNLKKFKEERGKIEHVPETEFALEAGRAVLVVVRMRNNTEWPLKQGCKVASFYSEEVAALLEAVCFPLDQYVAGEQTYEFAIPLKLKEGASLESSELFTADFKLQGPGGKTFGESIAIKFRV